MAHSQRFLRARLGRGCVFAGCGLLLLLSAAGCGEEPSGLRFELLERMAFLPAGSCVLFAGSHAPVDCSGAEPLLVDRFETTQADWSRWSLASAGGQAGLAAQGFWNDLAPHHPATGMTQAEAQAFAAHLGMRLPTAREWIRIAAGSRAQVWPWGPFPARSAANTLDLGLERLAPVGSFESGRTALGVHDLLGNAAEWASDLLTDPAAAEGPEDGRVWAMGGSFRRFKRETYSPGDDQRARYNAELLDPSHRSHDLGLRLVAGAEAWLRRESEDWPDSPEAHARLRAVGAAWGRAAVPLLRRLSRAEGARPGFKALLFGASQ
jgi:GNAT superfamily N-acetyltransferase